MTEQSTEYKVNVRRSIYERLNTQAGRQDKPVEELVDKALIKYLQKIEPNYWLRKRVNVHDDMYRLLEEESQRTGKSIQHIANNAFIQYLQTINSQANTA